MENKILTGSIVVFDETLSDLDNTINCFLNIPLKKKLYLIDNTFNNFFQYLFNHSDIEYIAIEENIGFGGGHNEVLEHLKDKSNYHLILNPDVSFQKDVIPNLILQLEKDNTVAMIAPKVIFPSGKHQYSCRRYPTPTELLARRFPFLKQFFKKALVTGEYRDKNLEEPFFAEYLTGCFQLYKTEDFVALKGFDARYFLYMEDIDICRKIDDLGKKKLYFPKLEIVHILKQGSSKNLILFFRHTSSAIKYFLKWGFR
ncbi:glycosyltransferase family 2 protein [uncultured Polaribacter sp.]|uniref:glycosyltransferase n=1 Tax=uncultured Polaribacter sp. TaxID=174711 RepID=UPI00261BB902|nr:glycosyltransferase family 2 protein [uncultured Polaribacter sp.]